MAKQPEKLKEYIKKLIKEYLVMGKRIKQIINEWLCKHFGHKIIKEVYAVRCDTLFGFPESNSKKAKYLYRIFIDERCHRCGAIKRNISEPMRRSQLLNQGWFISIPE